jgi:hypothetical protein
MTGTICRNQAGVTWVGSSEAAIAVKMRGRMCGGHLCAIIEVCAGAVIELRLGDRRDRRVGEDLEDVLVIRGWGMLVFDTVEKIGKRSRGEGIVKMLTIEIRRCKKWVGCIKESVIRVSDGKLVDVDSVDTEAVVESEEIVDR